MSLDIAWTGAAFLGAAWVATEAARQLAADIDLALRRARLSRKEAQDYTGLDEKKLSDCLTCKAPLNIFRLADLPAAFWAAFDEIRAERSGRVLFERDMVKLIVRVGEKRMARMALVPAKKQKETA